MGAKNPAEYVRMAKKFANDNDGLIKNATPRPDGTVRVNSGDNFIIMRGNNIVSYGAK